MLVDRRVTEERDSAHRPTLHRIPQRVLAAGAMLESDIRVRCDASSIASALLTLPSSRARSGVAESAVNRRQGAQLATLSH